eukprot:COSAG02_NODE_45518_length_356_cov_1.011673_1_plen_45_part_10
MTHEPKLPLALPMSHVGSGCPPQVAMGALMEMAASTGGSQLQRQL